MIETTRTILRPFAASDNESLFRYRSDAETNRYQGWIPKSIEEVDEFIRKIPVEFNKPETWFQLAIEVKEGNKLIGDVGIHFIDDHQCELGVTLIKDTHGKGLATEVLKAVIEYLFIKLHKHRITASIDPENTASIKLVERLGFRKEAHFKQSLLIDGHWIDDIIYAILSSEWM